MPTEAATLNNAFSSNGLKDYVESIETVKVEVPFYERLIAIASDSFVNVSLNSIKSSLINSIERANDKTVLVHIAKEFIEETDFIERVTSERQRIEYSKL